MQLRYTTRCKRRTAGQSISYSRERDDWRHKQGRSRPIVKKSGRIPSRGACFRRSVAGIYLGCIPEVSCRRWSTKKGGGVFSRASEGRTIRTACVFNALVVSHAVGVPGSQRTSRSLYPERPFERSASARFLKNGSLSLTHAK